MDPGADPGSDLGVDPGVDLGGPGGFPNPVLCVSPSPAIPVQNPDVPDMIATVPKNVQMKRDFALVYPCAVTSIHMFAHSLHQK